MLTKLTAQRAVKTTFTQVHVHGLLGAALHRFVKSINRTCTHAAARSVKSTRRIHSWSLSLRNHAQCMGQFQSENEESRIILKRKMKYRASLLSNSFSCNHINSL